MLNRRYLLVAMAAVMLWAGASCGAMTLAENGQAKAVIVVDASASESVQHAAKELADFLEQISGGSFTVTDEAPRSGSRVYVGPQAAKQIDPTFLTGGLGHDGIVVKTVGDHLVLAGGEPRGTLYAVYTFLEDYLGCRWWSSTESTIPKKPTLEIGEIRVRYTPILEYREPFWFDAHDGDWAVRNKCNGNSVRADGVRGGKHRYEGFVHTFYPLIPPAKYFDAHPEWFSEIDGKRTTKRTQLCLTNEAMRQELVKNLRERLRANPTATIASVSQNDWHGNCQCAKCATIEKEEGSPAGLMIRFVNAVAEDIEEEFPHVAISTLAYQYTRRPPKHVKPRDNVIVRLCSIEASFSVPLAHERNKPFRDDIIGWSKICDRLYVWDYVTNFRHHIMPHPNLRVLGPNVKFFADHSVKGIFEQGAYTTNGAEMAELRAWVLAKLLWDPSRDGDALTNEFIEGYYGSAAPHIKAYLEVTHDAVAKSRNWLGCFEKFTANFLSFDTLARGWEHLAKAEVAVRDDPDLYFRVQVAQLPVMYTFMMRWDEMRDAAQQSGADWPMPDSIQETYDRFMIVARKKNITRLDEWNEGFGNLDKALKRAQK
jgi:Domain of unknown function (DUF4838)/Glycosyl hydrolase family 67 N-terminus